MVTFYYTQILFVYENINVCYKCQREIEIDLLNTYYDNMYLLCHIAHINCNIGAIHILITIYGCKKYICNMLNVYCVNILNKYIYVYLYFF